MHQDQTDFFNTHSLHYIEMALSTDRIERLADPDGYGKRTGECGDTAEFFLICKDNILQSVSFDVHGCMNTTACCNTVAKLAMGKTIEAAWEISPEKVNRFLETLPGDHFHCAELAVGALYLALTDINGNTTKKRPKENTTDMTQILLVSPEKNVFKTLGVSFSENGIATEWTDTAEKALSILSQGKFDLILLHEQLPDMTGRKLVEKIITQNAMLNCVVLSTLSKEEFHEAYEGLGVLMQFSLMPGKAEAQRLIDHLARIRRISDQVKPLKGDIKQ